VPEPVHYDPAAVRLVLRSPPGGRDFHLHYAGRRAPRSAARALGQGLAAVHAARPALDQPAVDRLWGLSLPEPPSAQLHELSAGALDLLARLQAGDALCERLRRLRAAPAQDGFVHGDLRWDNCLALGGRKTRVLLIDWELAGHGDPAADVGAALAEPLRLWVGSLPLSDPADPLRLRAHARHPLTALRPSIGAFWAGYQNAAVRPVAAERAVELAAARLVQAAVEHAQGLARASAHVLALLQLADNLLADPADAAHGLLGLTG
jgi:aminoglycoside phosphotransferase (APT) family kinase protein